MVATGCKGRNARDRANNTAGPGTGAVGTAGSTDNSQPSRGDKDFVHDVALANMIEIDLGKVASERAANADVKTFGQLMADDHTRAGEKLKALATDINIDFPSQLDDKYREKRDKLSTKHSPEFDRDYIDLMVDEHKDMVDKLESRVDKRNLAEWKAEMTDRVSAQKAQERGQVMAILPEHSDNAMTARINEWAAATYPVAYAHREAAETLKKDLAKRHTNP
jgi:putative membrane protein